MADENKVKLVFEVDAKDASKIISGLEKETVQAVSSMEKAFSSLKFAAGAALAVFAGAKLVGFLEDSIKAAGEAEQAVQRLNLSLASTGEFSEEASQGFQDYAQALQDATGIADEAVLSAVSLAKSFGITNEQAKQLTSAALDLSAITGDDLNTAVQKLGGTYSGTIGKLSKLGPEFKNLTELQLKNGEAVGLLEKRFGGLGLAIGNTFQGAVAKASTNFGDIFENFGKGITESAVVVSFINILSEAFKEFAKFIQENQVVITTFVSEGLKAIVNAVPFVVAGISVLAEGFGNVAKYVAIAVGGIVNGIRAIVEAISLIPGPQQSALESTAAALNELSDEALKYAVDIEKGFGEATKSIDDFGVSAAKQAQKLDAIDSGAKTATKTVKNLGKQSRDSAKEVEDLINAIINGLGNTIEKEALKAGEFLKKISDLEALGALETQKAYDLRSRVITDFNKKVDEELKRQAEEQTKIIQKQKDDIAKIVADPFSTADIDTTTTAGQRLGAAIAGGFSSALKGKDGAIDLLSKGFGAAVDAFLPGFGAAASEIFKILASNNREQIKTFITDFVDAIPEIILAVTENLPEAIIRLIEKIFSAEFLVKFGVAMGRAFLIVVTGGFVSQAFRERVGSGIADAFKKNLYGQGGQIAEEFKKGFQEGIDSFFAGFAKIVSETIPNAISQGAVQLGQLFTTALPTAFANGGLALTQGILNGAQRFGETIGAAGAQFSSQVLGGILTGAAGFVSAIGSAFSEVYQKLKQAIIDGFAEAGKFLLGPIDKLIDFLSNFSFPEVGVGGGGGGGILGKVGGAIGGAVGGSIPGFAEGGTVPPGFPNDTFLAGLSSGEKVVTPEQQAQGDGMVIALLTQILTVLAQPMSAVAEAKVNESVFADIMLQLNRTNARTAA